MKRVRSSPELAPPTVDEEWATAPPDAWLALQQLKIGWSGAVRVAGGVWTVLSAVPAFPLTALRGVLGPRGSLTLDKEIRELSGAAAGPQRVRLCALGGERALVADADLSTYCERESAGVDVVFIDFYTTLARSFDGPTIAICDISSAFRSWALFWVQRTHTPAPPLENVLRILCHRGLLVRIKAAGDVAFGVPNCGRLVAALGEGRKAFVARLKKAGTAGVSRGAILSGAPLGREGLSTAFLLRDAVGAGTAVIVQTSTGAIVRFKN